MENWRSRCACGLAGHSVGGAGVLPRFAGSWLTDFVCSCDFDLCPWWARSGLIGHLAIGFRALNGYVFDIHGMRMGCDEKKYGRCGSVHFLEASGWWR